MTGMRGKLNFSWVIEGRLAGHNAPTSERDLAWLKEQGVLALVRMIEPHQAEVTSNQIEKLGMWDCHEPVPDRTAPLPEQIDQIILFIKASNEAHRPVGVSCTAGIGRTGTILACVLVSEGYDAEAAIGEIRLKRPGSIETRGQEDAIRRYARNIHP